MIGQLSNTIKLLKKVNVLYVRSSPQPPRGGKKISVGNPNCVDSNSNY